MPMDTLRCPSMVNVTILAVQDMDGLDFTVHLSQRLMEKSRCHGHASLELNNSLLICGSTRKYISACTTVNNIDLWR